MVKALFKTHKNTVEIQHSKTNSLHLLLLLLLSLNLDSVEYKCKQMITMEQCRRFRLNTP